MNATALVIIVTLITAIGGFGIATTTTAALAGSDSGNGAIGHIGACHKSNEPTFGKNAVGICGPTGPAMGMGPLDSDALGHSGACHELSVVEHHTHQQAVRICGPG